MYILEDPEDKVLVKEYRISTLYSQAINIIEMKNIIKVFFSNNGFIHGEHDEIGFRYFGESRETKITQLKGKLIEALYL